MGKRWKPAILWKMSEGIHRFGELKRALPVITEKMLAQHLKELESDGLIIRKVHSDFPLKVEYSLTQLGASLKPILGQIGEWAQLAKAARLTDCNPT